MSTVRMRPIKETISLEEARAILADTIRPIERTERVSLADATGRVVARPVVSERDVPPFARAAMDGYAVRAADTFGATQFEPRVLAAVETIYTGQVPTRPVSDGQCAEIATGAIVCDSTRVPLTAFA
jgi:molybdopterin biosynthesis enzyme